ncbi:MAG: hypothetical protein CBC38_05580 [Gammaproteobacteria bacterium TMED78]|nr:MAG: hypothetical protein CBC38_05580 [Gammaproteobacteria bacterium TMED78]|tara:strand:+ start:381 stop:1034 length:654 start_codon:yes stop_codon:yes gene_type:complete
MIKYYLIFLFISFYLAGCSRTLVDYSVDSHIVKEGETLQHIALNYKVSYENLISLNNIHDPNTIFPGQRLIIRDPNFKKNSSDSGYVNKVIKAKKNIWNLPAEGKIIRKFNNDQELSNGIGIGGSIGNDVFATLSGTVVYAGEGLVSYGKLIIIRHDDIYLSAYGFNHILFISEGDKVEAGQIISQMGDGPGNIPQLYFEIRENGIPIDPMIYLENL